MKSTAPEKGWGASPLTVSRGVKESEEGSLSRPETAAPTLSPNVTTREKRRLRFREPSQRRPEIKEE